MHSRDINETVIESLYAEALVLADEARFAFNPSWGAGEGVDGDLARLALSVEGLRTTTRIMHVLAWLLNHRAYLSGELSDSQLRRFGSLPSERASDPEQVNLLEPETQALIEESERLHSRVARLDDAWRNQRAKQAPIMAMQGRIAAAFELR